MSGQPIPDPYDAVLADLRAQRDEIDKTIQNIERVRSLNFGGATSGGVDRRAAPATEPNGAIESGLFFGLSLPEASKKLLSLKKKNLTNAEVIDGLEAGGLVMQSENKANTINSVLTRRFQQIGDIVRVKRGVWGLSEWHPSIRYRAKDDSDNEPEAAAS